MTETEYLRSAEAAEYLRAKYGHGSYRTLAKLRVLGGGPKFHQAGGRVIVYTRAALDKWAKAKLSGALTVTPPTRFKGVHRSGRPKKVAMMIKVATMSVVD